MFWILIYEPGAEYDAHLYGSPYGTVCFKNRLAAQKYIDEELKPITEAGGICSIIENPSFILTEG